MDTSESTIHARWNRQQRAGSLARRKTFCDTEQFGTAGQSVSGVPTAFIERFDGIVGGPENV